MPKIKDVLEKHLNDLLKLLIFLILLLSLGIIFILFKGNKADKVMENNLIDELFIESEENNLPNTDETEEMDKIGKILVDLKGAIKTPGVYDMEVDSRVIDCVEKAGGFLETADQKLINLAQRLEDQMVIYVPTIGEDSQAIENIHGNILEDSNTKGEHNQIDLNKASKEELKNLNGIGDKKAENIITYRETNGFFQKIEEIKNVSGIGEATFEKLKEEIKVSY